MKKLVISKLKPGMTVAKAIVTKRGQMIAKEGTELTSPLIARLSFYKIETVMVEDPEGEEQGSTLIQDSLSDGSQPHTLSEPEVPQAKAPPVEAKPEPKVIASPAPVSASPEAEKSVVASTYSYRQKLKQSPKFQEFQMSYSCNMGELRKNFDAMIAGDDSVSYDILLKEASDLFKSKTSLELFDMLHNMRSIDDSIYAHSLNVALIARAIGKWLKFSREDLDTLTVSGLLHDIGKTQIPEAILNKPGKYTDEELKLVQQHPLLGHKILKNKNFDERVKIAALQHHERADGSGYPRGLEGDEINDFASIIAIADVYDAMTAARSYRVPKCAFQVIAAFEDDGLQKYNTKFILTFLERVANAYQNSRIMLSNAEAAQIIYINKGFLSRPIVQTDEGEIIDLSKNKELYIQSIM